MRYPISSLAPRTSPETEGHETEESREVRAGSGDLDGGYAGILAA